VFAYLQYGPEQEREVERAFERWLRARGAWLDAPAGGMYDAAAEGDRPLVSVVIPCRNRVRFVRMAVESALAQTYDPLEVLLIDNGSGDGSPESVEELGDRRVRVIRNDGTTISSALNRGVREARGMYVAQLDSDDLYVPHTVEAAVACLKSHPRAGLAVSYYECIDPDGRPLPELGVVKHLEYSRNNILRCNGAGAVRVWRKGIVLELGGFDEGPLANYGEDYDLLLKVGERYEVERIHDVLYRYRRHAGNTDAVRDPLDNIRLKTLARHRALRRRTGRTTPT
jgi:alpha-1,6-rhamnosyltransferase